MVMMIVCRMMLLIVVSKINVPKRIHELDLGLLLECIRFLRTIIDVSVHQMTWDLYEISTPLNHTDKRFANAFSDAFLRIVFFFLRNIGLSLQIF